MILIGFEESGIITGKLIDKGIEAYSCDLKKTSGKYPQQHIQTDIEEALTMKTWDAIIIHPPCTYTALCGNKHYAGTQKREEAAQYTKKIWELSNKISKFVALEQPKTIMQRYIGIKTQTIQPWQFGHGETKATWLWLTGFPKLIPTNIVKEREERIWKMGGNNRSELRSKTYPGIADAIVNQWFHQ